jgi:hypothetical protein
MPHLAPILLKAYLLGSSYEQTDQNITVGSLISVADVTAGTVYPKRVKIGVVVDAG